MNQAWVMTRASPHRPAEMLAPSGPDGKAAPYDGAADLWSFGCLAYALLAGRGPFWCVGVCALGSSHATRRLLSPRF